MGGKLTQKNGKRLAGGKPIPKSDFALPKQNAYPIDTAKRARSALSRIAQYGTPAQKAKVQRAVASRYRGQITVSHTNEGPSMHYDFAGGNAFSCPNCGYSGGPDDFRSNDGDYDNDSARRDGNGITPDALRTPAPSTYGVRSGVPLSVRGASSGNLGLANRGQRHINLARRLPVRQIPDVIVNRREDGTAVVRHRQGGNEIGTMRRTEAGWVSTVNGRDLEPRGQQRNALLDMFGNYNRLAAEQPFQAPPVQTPLMEQFNIPAIRLASSDDDADNDDAASSDTSGGSGGNGLNPRGQGIYKKLVAKGVKPAVAMAMAKRAQNTKSGAFGQKAS